MNLASISNSTNIGLFGIFWCVSVMLIVSCIQECLKKIREYKKLDNIQVTAWDPKSPRTIAYKYEGAEDNTLVFKAQDNDEFTNKNLYDILMNDLAAIDNDIVIVKFDKCKWIQSLSVYQDDFYQKDAYILAFEG